MGHFEIFMLAVALAADACAVSASAGACGRSSGYRAWFRFGFHFGLFQFLMPVVGWYAGSLVSNLISVVDHWIAFGLLAFVGSRMILSGLKPESNKGRSDPSRGWSLVMLSVATSIDALAVGFSLSMVNQDIWLPAVVIGIVTVVLSIVGLELGRRLGAVFGPKVELAGGVVLVLIGVKILWEHMLF